jgi:hypothetical protein
MNHSSRPTFGLAFFAGLAALLIGYALQLRDDHLPHELFWLAAAIVCVGIGFIVPRLACRSVALTTCVIGILWQIQQSMATPPMNGHVDPYVTFYFGNLAIPLLMVSALGAVLLDRWSRAVFIPLLLATHFLVGLYLLRQTPPPFIDTYEGIRQACINLSHGHNPFAGDFRDIYQNTPGLDEKLYPPGLVVNGRVQLGYAYMPLSLIVNFAAHVIAGDFRVGNLLALTVAGGLLAYCRRGPFPAAAAAILLLSSRGYFIVQQAWVDPVVICSLAAVLFFACRKSGALPYSVGLLFVSKQYMFLAAPAIGLLAPWPWQGQSGVKFWLKAVAAGTVVTLPAMLVNFGAFWHSVFSVHLRSPFRTDSMSFVAAWVRSGHAAPPSFVAFIVAGLAALAGLRAPRTPAGFAATTSLIFLCFFATGRQAFDNYYFFTIGALCCVVAATEMPEPTA